MIAVNYTPGAPRGAVTGGTRDIIYNRFAGPLFRPRFRRGVAQPGSAPALGAGGPRFKSGRPDQFLPGVVDRMLLGRCSGFRQVSASKIMRVSTAAFPYWEKYLARSRRRSSSL